MARRYHELRCDVRFWHMADVQTALMNVRFEGNNGDADVTRCRLMTLSEQLRRVRPHDRTSIPRYFASCGKMLCKQEEP